MYLRKLINMNVLLCFQFRNFIEDPESLVYQQTEENILFCSL